MMWLRIKRVALISLTIVLFTGNTAFAQVISAADPIQFKEAVISNMVNRNTTFTINYTGDANKFLSKANDYIRQAYTSDDYLRWSWTSISPKIVKGAENVDVTFTAAYISTKDQEDYVETEISKIISQIITPDMTGKQKVKAIHDFVLKTADYDYTLQSRSTYLALTTGKAVCQGYAMLVYKLCEKAEIPVHIVTGNIPAGYHAWNEVQIDGNWYYIDTTFDDVKSNQYKFFCVTDDFLTQNNYTWNNKAFPCATSKYIDDAPTVAAN